MYANNTENNDQVLQTIDSLLDYLEKSNYKGHEAYDVLTPSLTRRIHPAILGALLTQLIRISPFPLQKLYKEPKQYSKAMSLIAHSCLMLYKILGDPQYREKAIYCLEWLIENKSAQSRHFSLGSGYNLSMKSYDSSADTPSPLITALAVEAMITAHQILGNDRYLQFAESGIRYFLEELAIIQVDSNLSYFTYHPNNPHFIPNLPALLCGTIARYNAMKPDPRVDEIISNNLRYVVKHQSSNGSWPYEPGAPYIDSFHTGFILEGLAKYQFYMRNTEFNQSLGKGLAFYLKTFFKSNGRPVHKILTGTPANADSLLTKLDLRDCAQALVLFNVLVKLMNFPMTTSWNLYDWCVKNFKSDAGYFYYQATPLYKIRGPFIAMQAWMLFGLVNLLDSMHTMNYK
ncbi:hypothetical protein JXB12_12550 [candidate division KSB1 bacterium]|nr:hypothetical protein [candidate division KSB1 bacterium]